jgi:hypothetical protein
MKKFSISLSLIFVLLLSFSLFAQIDTLDRRTEPRTDTQTRTDVQDHTGMQDDQTWRRNAETWSGNVHNEFQLRDDQRTRLNDIMVDYQRERAMIGSDIPDRDQRLQELQMRYNQRLDGVFEENQRTNWQTYRQNWWNDINTELDGNQMNYQDNINRENVNPEYHDQQRMPEDQRRDVPERERTEQEEPQRIE